MTSGLKGRKHSNTEMENGEQLFTWTRNQLQRKSKELEQYPIGKIQVQIYFTPSWQ